MFWKLELLRIVLKHGRLIVHSSQFEMMLWKFELLRKLKMNRLHNDAFCLNLKRAQNIFIIIEFSGPDVILKRLFVSYTILYFENGIP